MSRLDKAIMAALVSGALAVTAPVNAQRDDSATDIARDAYNEFRDFQQARADRDDTRTGRQQTLGRQDLEVAEKALRASVGSIELARLAEDRARDAELREFARTVRQHHQAAARDIASLSPQLNARRAEPGELDQWAIDRLRNIDNDREFQEAYAELSVARHKMAIDGLQMVSESSRYNPELRDYADQQLDTLQQHLRTAQRIEEDVQFAGQDTGDDDY